MNGFLYSLFSAVSPIRGPVTHVSPTHPPGPYNHLLKDRDPWLMPRPAPATDRAKVSTPN